MTTERVLDMTERNQNMDEILDAAHMESLEQDQPELPAPTYAEVTDHLTRMRYHRKRIEQYGAETKEIMDRLQAQMDRVLAAHEQRIASHQHSLEWHTDRVVLYAQQNPPHKGRTVHLPGATVSARAQSPEWVWPTDASQIAEIIDRLQQSGLHACIRVPAPPPPAIDKVAIKKLGQVQDGKLLVPGPESQLVELPGVSVIERGVAYTVDLEGV